MDEKVVNVNIEAIMEEIRAEIKREQAASVDVSRMMDEIRAEIQENPRDAVPAFDDVPTPSPALIPRSDLAQPVQMVEDGVLTQQIVNEAQFLKANHYIPYYRDMGKGPKSFFKRIIRKLNRCNVLPISDDQNTFNLHVANGIDALRAGFEYHAQILNSQSIIQQAEVHRVLEITNQRLDKLDESLEGQWSAIELLQEQTDEQRGALDYEALEERLSQIEAVLESIRAELREHGIAIKKQRQAQFVSNDKVTLLQQKVSRLDQSAMHTMNECQD